MKKNKIIIILIASAIIAGVVIAGYIIRKSKLDDFKNNGIETIATITELIKDKAHKITSKGQKRKSEYSIQVTYFTKNEVKDSLKNEKTISKDIKGNYKLNLDKFKTKMGKFVMTEIEISASQFKRLKKNQKIQIIYLKDDIEKAMLKDDIK